MAKLWILIRDGDDVRRFEQTGDVMRLEPIHRQLALACNTGRSGAIAFQPDGGDPVSVLCENLVGAGLHAEEMEPPTGPLGA